MIKLLQGKDHVTLALCTFSLGLFPVFFTSSLKTILVVVLVYLIASARNLKKDDFTDFSWPVIAIAQFFIFFLINALIYPVYEGNRPHYRPIAIESWLSSLICLYVLTIWLSAQNADNVKRALLLWLPASLTLTFVIATAFFLSGIQGQRIEMFTPNALIPPMWFLALTMTSFSWFFEMSARQKTWRIALFLMAGVMALYGSARLIMIAWVICGIVLAVWIISASAAQTRKRTLFIVLGFALISIAGIAVIDSFTDDLMKRRMIHIFASGLSYEALASRTPRFADWPASIAIIKDNLWFGIGQVNERIAIKERLDSPNWWRAHQGYFSYLIAGGIPALISGLIFQSIILPFLSREVRSTLFPIFIGLGIAITLNMLTDSVFQSVVNAQAYMLAVLVFLKAKESSLTT